MNVQEGLRRTVRGWGLVFCISATLLTSAANADPITVFSASPDYKTPETISVAPNSFGAFGGHYFVPDFNRGVDDGPLWRIDPGGGAPNLFATIPVINARGGLFLPDAGWGGRSGQFLAAGPELDGGETGMSRLYTFDSDGSASLFLETAGSFAQSRIAPDGFGTIGGDLVVANFFFGPGAGLVSINAAGDVDLFAPTTIFPFGLAFAPDNFGDFGGQAFLSSALDGKIVAVDSNGVETLFADIPLLDGQPSLFQMAFSPAGFLPGLPELLFVSVRGSSSGGGTLGDVVALTSKGDIVARMRSDHGLAKFDPRGLLFTDDGLFVSDASDPILILAPNALSPVPEPTTLSLFCIGLVGVGIAARRRRRETSTLPGDLDG